ncbi:hypothetical protein DF034_17430 [Burkholderia anthina]|uniref:hypothetical protein n=1 Tax=Burkholderia anthina TaxID=179879 RepID=UPI000F5DCB98|nr:hypothetical protein [Burkholderia anthina]RQX81797.1 hypothetical protein DF034_17430 [Burkholderia anthina]
MSIIGTLPNILTNGTTADASQVMADLNYIANQVNANATPLGTLTAPSGTRIPMNQQSAPVGWTQDTSAALNDCSVRVVTTGGGGTGGVVAWSTWNFGGTFNVTPFTLSIAQLPPHSHVDTGHTHGLTDNGHAHGPGSGTAFYTNAAGPGNFGGGGTAINTVNTTATAATGVSVNAGVANLQNTGSGANISPTFTTPQMKYTDLIIAVKS